MLTSPPPAHRLVGIQGTVADDIADNQFRVAAGNKVQTYLYYGLENPAVNYPNPGATDIYQSNPTGDNFEDYVDGFTRGLNFASALRPFRPQSTGEDGRGLRGSER